MPLLIRRIDHASPEYDAAIALRRAVLRTPLGLDFTAEQLASEAPDTHLAAFDDGDLIGTVVLTPYGENAFKLRQMAVADSHRRRNIGAQLLSAAEAHALAQGITHILLAARVTAQEFYARHGYLAEGDVYTEVTIPHITMSKFLISPCA